LIVAISAITISPINGPSTYQAVSLQGLIRSNLPAGPI
jgi:hypothetical protein